MIYPNITINEGSGTPLISLIWPRLKKQFFMQLFKKKTRFPTKMQI